MDTRASLRSRPSFAALLCLLLPAVMLAGCLWSPIVASPNSPLAPAQPPLETGPMAPPAPPPVATIPIAPPAPGQTAAPVLPAAQSNPWPVGLYRSEVFTQAGSGSWTEVATVTLSLFGDGSYQELLDWETDWGTHREPRGSFVSPGFWQNLGDALSLTDSGGPMGSIFALGSDGLIVARARSAWPLFLETSVVMRVSTQPEPLFHCAAKAAWHAAQSEVAPDAALAGIYRSAPSAGEGGAASHVLALHENGWAEAYTDFPDQARPPEEVQWGLWKAAPAAASGAQTITFVALGTPDSIHNAHAVSWVWDAGMQQLKTEGANPALVRTNGAPAPHLHSLHDFLFAGATNETSLPPSDQSCQWERP